MRIGRMGSFFQYHDKTVIFLIKNMMIFHAGIGTFITK